MSETSYFALLTLASFIIGLCNIFIIYNFVDCNLKYSLVKENYSRDIEIKSDINTREYTIPTLQRPLLNVQPEKTFTKTTENFNKRMKTLYVHGNSDIKEGDDIFQKLQCPVRSCKITTNLTEGKSADFVLFGYFSAVPNNPPFSRKSRDQVWAVQILEAPTHEPNFQNYRGLVNWTMTYRSDSTIPFPYFKFKYYVEPKMRVKQPNFAAGKTKKVAWLTSNLSAKFRFQYFKELRKHIEADMVGQKSKIKCPYDDMYNCLEGLRKDYKFYFASENMFCNEYMTEKVARNAYKYEMIPIVLGARKEDYERRLPQKSFIFAEDFKSPKQLANYLHKIDQNDTLFNEFFQYRKYSYVEEEFSPPWCELCRKIHFTHDEKPTWYDDVNFWWHEDSCRKPPYHILYDK